MMNTESCFTKSALLTKKKLGEVYQERGITWGGGEVKSRFFSEYICYHLKSCVWLSHPQKSSLSIVGVALALGYYANFKMADFLELPMVTKIGTL